MDQLPAASPAVPDPATNAAPVAAPRRGRLRIFLGATPGSGKTYAMLREGQDRLAQGSDVVVGFVETHGRPRTAAALEGLDVIPRRCRDWHGRPCEDMDVDAVLRRAPAIALVDELAHTNLPGGRHEKRWQDVEALRASGIDVLTTVNIQAVESVKDLVENITGIPVRETIPDAVVDGADEIQFIDISPEALRKRMRHGNIYAPEKVDIALSNFFRPGNLAALREIALRTIAQTVGRASGTVRGTPQDVLVAVSGRPSSEPLVRRGARMARRFGGFCTVLRIVDEHIDVSPEIVGRCRTLAQELGCTWREVDGGDLDDAVVTAARELGVQHVLVGEASPSGLVGRFRKGLVDRLVDELPDVSLHVIAREERHRSAPAPRPARAEAAASPGAPTGRGTLRLYLGYARGCGITTTMLEEARRRQSRGTDVVVASVLIDGHPETAGHLEGLELLGGREGPGAHAVLDLPALLARRPAVVCVDELTRPGTDGRPAAASLQAILEAGITVIATLHLVELESARQQLGGRLTPRPDDLPAVTVDVLGLADEVEIVDVTPEILVDRLGRGEITPAEGAAAALAGDYRVEILAALRELAFRVIAQHTDRRLVAYMRERKIAAPWEARPRVMTCVPAREGMEWLVRRSAALARAIDGDLHVVTVFDRGSDALPAPVAEYEALTGTLGGRFVLLRDRRVVPALAEYAQRELVTEVIVTRGEGGHVRRSTLRELLRTLSDVDVHVLSTAEG